MLRTPAPLNGTLGGTKMKLYKLRSMSPAEYALDILISERLYCAPYDKLNDPFEGVFMSALTIGGAIGSVPLGFGPIGGIQKFTKLATIAELPINTRSRVCSLSKAITDIRLWSHYGGGHAGIAIEIEIDPSEDLHQVTYKTQLSEFTSSLLGGPRTTDVLCVKTTHWEYEQEYRLITEDEYYPIPGKVAAVYLGHRMPELMRNLILRILPPEIPAFETKLNPNTVQIETGSQIPRGPAK